MAEAGDAFVVRCDDRKRAELNGPKMLQIVPKSMQRRKDLIKNRHGDQFQNRRYIKGNEAIGEGGDHVVGGIG